MTKDAWTYVWISIILPIIAVALSMFLSGCEHFSPPPQTVAIREVTTPQGAKIREEIRAVVPRESITGSQAAALLPPFTLGAETAEAPVPYQESVPMQATMNGGATTTAITAGDQATAWGAKMFYGLAGLLVIAGLVLAWQAHFKLCGLAFAGAAVAVTAAVLVGKYAFVFLAIGVAGAIAVLTFIGWALWRDYKDDGKINGSSLANAK